MKTNKKDDKLGSLDRYSSLISIYINVNINVQFDSHVVVTLWKYEIMIYINVNKFWWVYPCVEKQLENIFWEKKNKIVKW